MWSDWYHLEVNICRLVFLEVRFFLFPVKTVNWDPVFMDGGTKILLIWFFPALISM